MTQDLALSNVKTDPLGTRETRQEEREIPKNDRQLCLTPSGTINF